MTQDFENDMNDEAGLDQVQSSDISDNMPASNAGNESAANANNDEQLADGLDVEMHGGGRLEGVGEFDGNNAMSEGMGSEVIPITDELAHLPPAGLLSYAGGDGETSNMQESVCGRDDRVRINSTASIPWRLICQLVMTFPNGARARGTGWMAGPRLVMTAGHCVYSARNGGWARSVEVIPGINAASRPFGTYRAITLRSVTGWTRSGRPSHDYGAVILNDYAGRRTGYFGFASLNRSSLNNLLVNSSGYSGDKPFGTQWYNSGRITRVQTRRLQYMIDTIGGNSGGPIWRYRNGVRHVVGIHNYGGCPNKASRITRAVFDNIISWRSI